MIIIKVVQDEKIFKFRECIFAICYYLPYKGVGFPFEQTQILFTHECFLPSLVEIGPVFQEKMIFQRTI